MIRVSLLVAFTLCLASAAIAQAPKQPTATSALCTRAHAIDSTKEQILFTRTFDRTVQRIAVLLRAADLLWPHDQERSLATFMEAFDLAVQDFKEQGDQIRRTSQSQYAAVTALPDQRFKVISALARRDPARARKLTEQVLDEAARKAADKPAADPRSQLTTAEKLLTLAHGLAATDVAAALSFARQSLRYPATLHLNTFLYQLARTISALPISSGRKRSLHTEQRQWTSFSISPPMRLVTRAMQARCRATRSTQFPKVSA